jgi:Druantia protein DruA
VTGASLIQGRQIGAAELDQVRHLLASHPDWSRRRLSEELATLWNWRNGAGQLKDMAARTLLLKLERRGWLELPPRRTTPFNRLRQKRLPQPGLAAAQAPVTGELKELLPLQISECSHADKASGQRALFDALLHQHHYLSHRGSIGENLQYLVGDAQARPLACVLFGAAAWQCAARDRYIGWESWGRAQHLHLIANNTRFLILPWVVGVAHLAGHVLSRITQRLSPDWQAKYGHPLYLLETFVQADRFTGTAYRAANWVRVGQTKGRTRQDRPEGTWHQAAVKDVYLYPLHRRFRRYLQGPAHSIQCYL